MINTATNYARASFSEVYDSHTEVGNVTVMTVHTPTNNLPQRMLFGFFAQFRKFRYLGASVTFVPVSTLPADPLQISYEAGEPTIDPRDMVNPIVFKGCHGNSLGIVLDSLVGPGLSRNEVGSSIGKASSSDVGTGSDTITPNAAFQASLEAVYYQALSDNSWKKAGVQQGFRKSLYPLVYKNVTTAQLAQSTAAPNPGGTGEPSETAGVILPSAFHKNLLGYASGLTYTESAFAGEFSNGLERMGWLDTQQMYYNAGNGPSGTMVNSQTGQYLTQLPKVQMLCIILPPAYKTEFYFRIVLTHHFEFKQFANCVGPDAFANNTNVVPAYEFDTTPAAAALSANDLQVFDDNTPSLDTTVGSPDAVTLVTAGVA